MVKDYKAIVSEVLTRHNGEKRYVVVNQEGDVIDNNKGEGFITESKAIRHYELKEFGHTKKDEIKQLGKKKRDNHKHVYIKSEATA